MKTFVNYVLLIMLSAHHNKKDTDNVTTFLRFTTATTGLVATLGVIFQIFT